MKNSTVDFINECLKVYGHNQYDDPIFRVVFSDNQIEKRQGIFNDYYGSIFIRTVREIREVLKYPWIKRKWILERWAPGEISYHKDLVTEKNGVYVCVYVFQDVNCNYLPPLLKVCEIIIKSLLNPRRLAEALAEDKTIGDKEDEKEVNEIEEELKIQSDGIATKDRKSYRESASVGYVSDKIKEN